MKLGEAEMRVLAVYTDHASKFEQLAADETDPKLKAHFEGQAAAYRKLAAKRANMLGGAPSRLVDRES
jgi:hypothetical protein